MGNSTLVCLLIFSVIINLVSNNVAYYYPKDVLPYLPHGISLPIMRKLYNEIELLPLYVASANSNGSEPWKGACFNDSTAWLDFHGEGATLHIKVKKAHSCSCMDVYLFATPYRVTWDWYFQSGEHTLEFNEWANQGEYEYVKQNGVSIFLMKAGLLGTIRAFSEIFLLFTNTGWGENSNIRFLKKHMGTTFDERPKPWVGNIDANRIHTGDLLAISKIRGSAGGFETMEKWVTGAYAGHVAVCLRDPVNGKLWVAESGRANDQGEDVVVMLPWEEWWEFEKQQDDSAPHIALLPLRWDLRDKINKSSAWAYAQSMVGKPYGYQNVVFSWIDTVKDNYPPPLDAHLVVSSMTLLNQVKPVYAAKLWSEALNKRLGTENLGIPEIIAEVARRNSTLDQLLKVPELDDWVYNSGRSVSCVAYAIHIYKDLGIFGPITSSIQATEFTVKDAYTLKIFESNSSRLPVWCNEGDTVKLPYCQILGKYRMELPEYNTIEPYPTMNQECPSLPPNYDRPNSC